MVSRDGYHTIPRTRQRNVDASRIVWLCFDLVRSTRHDTDHMSYPERLHVLKSLSRCTILGQWSPKVKCTCHIPEEHSADGLADFSALDYTFDRTSTVFNKPVMTEDMESLATATVVVLALLVPYVLVLCWVVCSNVPLGIFAGERGLVPPHRRVPQAPLQAAALSFFSDRLCWGRKC